MATKIIAKESGVADATEIVKEMQVSLDPEFYLLCFLSASILPLSMG
jgi:hypothetical protein